MVRGPLKTEAAELRLDVESLLPSLDWRRVFGKSGRVEVEIGIGKGRFLLAAAAARPDVLHFGIEWANKYLRIAEARALRRDLRNVRFVRADARELLEQAFPDQSVSTFYVFYPDPWPKKRHHKRRFLNPSTVGHLARTLLPLGVAHVCTDHAEYWEQIELAFECSSAFERLPKFGGDSFPLPVDQPLTNFEAKYLHEGRRRFRASWLRLKERSWRASPTGISVADRESCPGLE